VGYGVSAVKRELIGSPGAKRTSGARLPKLAVHPLERGPCSDTRTLPAAPSHDCRPWAINESSSPPRRLCDESPAPRGQHCPGRGPGESQRHGHTGHGGIYGKAVAMPSRTWRKAVRGRFHRGGREGRQGAALRPLRSLRWKRGRGKAFTAERSENAEKSRLAPACRKLTPDEGQTTVSD